LCYNVCMKKKVLFIVIVLALVFGAGFMIFTATQSYKVDTTDDNKETTTSQTSTSKKVNAAYVNKDAKVSDITKEDGKVNIYMFWGNGCPHCKAQWEYFEALRKEYPNDFKVYGFEVWNNESNRELLDVFAAAMGDEKINSVPYTIIGDKSYVGAKSEEIWAELIEEYKTKGIDVYFDKIK